MSDLSNIKRRYTKDQIEDMAKEAAADFASLEGILKGFRDNGHPLPEHESLLSAQKDILERARKMLKKAE